MILDEDNPTKQMLLQMFTIIFCLFIRTIAHFIQFQQQNTADSIGELVTE